MLIIIYFLKRRLRVTLKTKLYQVYQVKINYFLNSATENKISPVKRRTSSLYVGGPYLGYMVDFVKVVVIHRGK